MYLKILENLSQMGENCNPEQQLKDKVDEWLKWDKNPQSRETIKKLADENNTQELEKKLLSRLTFGTAGLRGKMVPGYSGMNDLVIIQTAQGLLKFLEKHRTAALKKSGIIIGYDGRHNSKKWAEYTATIFSNAGYQVRLFSDYLPTPFVPFGIRQYGCASGIMVTASHNPKDDNGYKVYDENGAQIIPPWDKIIQNSIIANLTPLESSWDTSTIKGNPLVLDPFADCLERYLKIVIGDGILPQDIENNKKLGMKFVYTAMHGVGYVPAQKVVDQIGIQILPVPEQKDPHPDFPTVKFPNPEEGKSSLELAIKHADANNVKVILANDPDADRFAIAEKGDKTGTWKIFTGNELGTLLGWWMLDVHKRKHPEIPLNKVYTIASTVSSMVLQTMAKAEGFNFVDTLTGFKWLGNKALSLTQEGYKVIFCFEEAIGYMCNINVLDKDGIGALANFACLATSVYSKNKQLVDQLAEIYDKYGLHISWNSYYFCYDKPKIEAIFDRIRNIKGPKQYPTGILNDKYKITSIRDLTIGYDSTTPDKKPTLPVSCSAQMLTFIFDNGLHITLRTSGTEPKVKFYSELCMTPDVKDRSVAEATLKEMVTAICQEFFEPDKNGLIPQSV